MAGPAQDFPTDRIGKYLEEKYGSEDPNTHIQCFYIRFGQEISKSPMMEQESLAILNDNSGLRLAHKWIYTEPGLIFVISPEATAPTERVREADINESIRLPLIRN